MGEPPSAGRSGGRRRPLILAAVALVLALVVVAVVANRNAGYRSAATAGASSGARAASSATARPRTAASNASTVGAAPATPTSDPSDEGADGSSGDPVSPDTPTVHIPAGFSLYRDVTGFSVAVPRGWTRSKRGTSVYFRNGRSYLQIDQTTHPQPDALRDWKNEEASADRRFSDYHLVRLEAIDYRNWDAADWEFTWRASSGTLHVINRNIRVNNHRAYALYWSVPAADWNQRWSDFELVARTFVPAS